MRRLVKLLLVVQIGLLAYPAKAQTPVATDTSAGTVTLTGIVRDGSGTALAAVEIIVNSAHRDITSRTGEFTIGGVPAGAIEFTARRVGYVPVRSIVQSDAGLVVQLSVKLVPSTVELETVVVEGKRLNRTLSENGYYRRANLGNGHFLTPEYLAQTSASISTLMHMIPSVRIERGFRGAAVAVGRRGTQFCALSVFVDGWYLSYAPSIGLDDIVSRYDVLAVEVYARPTQVPMRYLGSGGSTTECGAMFIWTKPVQVRSETKRPKS